jgi:tRNA nucleotidyltransferase (CCA-adding enzyme)
LVTSSVLATLLSPAPENGLLDLHPTLLSQLDIDKSSRSRLYLAAALSPFRGLTYLDKKNKSHSVVELVIRESLKLGTQNHFLDGVPALYDAAALLKTPDLTDKRFSEPSERVAIGLLLRNKSVHNINAGSHWTSSLLFSLVEEIALLHAEQTELDGPSLSLNYVVYLLIFPSQLLPPLVLSSCITLSSFEWRNLSLDQQ